MQCILCKHGKTYPGKVTMTTERSMHLSSIDEMINICPLTDSDASRYNFLQNFSAITDPAV